MSKTPIYSISICARATMDMHSLNNEGGEGNQIQTRMVNIVDQDGELQNVNAVSGDMYKHIQAAHLFEIARSNPGIPLSDGAAEFNANRINADSAFQAMAKDKSVGDAVLLDAMLQRCAVSDMEGTLVTEGRSLPRKSVVEFGWVVGLPQHVETDSYFHAKYVSKDRAKTAESREAESGGGNLGQNIFHRPASSGIYAIVCHLDLARIGFNDITQQYAINDEQRALRARALLESVLYTFLQPDGAMRSTQAPHIVNLEGVVSISMGATPAPTVSPLKADYREQVVRIQQALQAIVPDTVVVEGFDDLASLTDIMGNLINSGMPYKLQYRRV